MTFKDIFPWLSRTLSYNFQDIPGSEWFSKTFQVLQFSTKNPGLSRRCGNSEHINPINLKKNSDLSKMRKIKYMQQ